LDLAELGAQLLDALLECRVGLLVLREPLRHRAVNIRRGVLTLIGRWLRDLRLAALHLFALRLRVRVAHSSFPAFSRLKGRGPQPAINRVLTRCGPACTCRHSPRLRLNSNRLR